MAPLQRARRRQRSARPAVMERRPLGLRQAVGRTGHHRRLLLRLNTPASESSLSATSKAAKNRAISLASARAARRRPIRGHPAALASATKRQPGLAVSAVNRCAPDGRSTSPRGAAPAHPAASSATCGDRRRTVRVDLGRPTQGQHAAVTALDHPAGRPGAARQTARPDPEQSSPHPAFGRWRRSALVTRRSRRRGWSAWS